MAINARVGKQLGHLANAPDIFLPILRRKAQILVQPMANVIAVQHISRMAGMLESADAPAPPASVDLPHPR